MYVGFYSLSKHISSQQYIVYVAIYHALEAKILNLHTNVGEERARNSLLSYTYQMRATRSMHMKYSQCNHY